MKIYMQKIQILKTLRASALYLTTRSMPLTLFIWKLVVSRSTSYMKRAVCLGMVVFGC